MNDLVSEYQQYQDATAEGKIEWFRILICNLVFVFAEEGEGGEEEGEQEGA